MLKIRISPYKDSRGAKRPYTWKVSFNDGTRYRRKFFTSRDKAHAWVADYKRKEHVSGELGALTPAERRAVSLWRESGLEGQLDVLVREAVERAQKRRESVSLAHAAEITIEARIRAGRAGRTVGDLNDKLGRFVRDLGEETSVATIETRDVEVWLHSLPLSPQSKVNFRRVVNTLFNECLRRGWIEKNPVEAVLVPRVDEGEIGFYSIEELSRLLTTAAGTSDVALAAIVLGGLCGLRTSEIEALEWKHIEREHIRIPGKTKTGKRLVPLPESAREWLRPIRRPEGSVVNGLQRTPLNEEIREVFRLAGIERRHNGLRHSFCTYRLGQTQDLARVALEAGNSPQIVRKHYMELVSQNEGDRWFSIFPSRAGKVVEIA